MEYTVADLKITEGKVQGKMLQSMFDVSRDKLNEPDGRCKACFYPDGQLVPVDVHILVENAP